MEPSTFEIVTNVLSPQQWLSSSIFSFKKLGLDFENIFED